MPRVPMQHLASWSGLVDDEVQGRLDVYLVASVQLRIWSMSLDLLVNIMQL